MYKIYHLLTNGVVTSGVVVGSVLLTIDQLFRMEKLTISSKSCLVNHSRFKIYKHSTGNMLTSSGLREESGKRVISKSFIGGHVTIRLNAMLEAIQLPAGITNLATSLTNMN